MRPVIFVCVLGWLFCVAAVSGPARADTVAFEGSGVDIPGVVIDDIKGGQLIFAPRDGELTKEPITRVTKILLDDVPELAEAEKADYAAATKLLDKARVRCRKRWQASWVDYRMLRLLDDNGKGLPAVKLYVKLVKDSQVDFGFALKPPILSLGELGNDLLQDAVDQVADAQAQLDQPNSRTNPTQRGKRDTVAQYLTNLRELQKRKAAGEDVKPFLKWMLNPKEPYVGSATPSTPGTPGKPITPTTPNGVGNAAVRRPAGLPLDVAFGQSVRTTAAPLATAKAQYERETLLHRKAFIAAMEDVIKTTAQSGNLAAVERLVKAQKEFETSGELPFATALAPAVAQYNQAIHSADQRLFMSYESAQRELTKQLQLDAARKVRDEKETFVSKRRLADADVEAWTALVAGPASNASVIEKHRGAVTALAFSSDGRELVSGGADAIVRWHNRLSDLTGNAATRAAINAIAVSPMSGATLVGRQDGTLEWHAFEGYPEGKPARFQPYKSPEVRTLASAVRGVAFSADGRHAAIGCADGSIHLLDGATGRESSTTKVGLGAGVVATTFGRSGPELFVVDTAGRLWFMDVTGGNITRAELDEEAVRAATVGSQMLFTGSSRTIVARRRGGATLTAQSLESVSSPVTCMALSGDEKTLVAGHENGEVSVWSTTPRLSLKQRFVAHEEAIRAIAFSPVNAMFCTAGDAGVIKLWDAGDR